MRARPLVASPLALGLAFALGVVTVARPASAKDLAEAYNLQSNAFDLQLFRPAIDTKGYITVNASQVLGLWDFSIGLVGTIAGNPLRLKGPNKTELVNDLVVTLPLQVTLGFKYLELGVSLPVHVTSGHAGPKYESPNSSNFNSALGYGSAGLGDLGIHLKGRFLNTSKHPVGLALLVSAYLPYLSQAVGHGERNFLSDGVFGLHPQLIVDKEFGRSRRLRAAFNLGARLRLGKTPSFTDGGQFFDDSGQRVCAPKRNTDSNSTLCGTGETRRLGQQLTYGIGVSGAVIPGRLDLLGELYGAIGLDGAKGSFPMELLVGAKIYLAKSSFLTVGGGGSPINAALAMTQSADWRLFVGFNFEPVIGDKDGDGFKDDVDKCPVDAEDFDDFADNDGCPEPDNDRDGLKDPDDKCPSEPETKNGFQDDDGCADEVELDRDGDTIPDSVDKCADDPEDNDVFEDEYGCPELYNDQDTVLDIDDRDPQSGRSCANDPEDRDGFEDQDGCPDPDNDKDRLVDVRDKCPNEPEV